MTHCIGWKHKGHVYLIADTAVTRPDKPLTPISSFGELHDAVRNGHVEEALLKILRVSDSTAIAYAGNVALAIEIGTFLKDHYSSHKSIDDLMKSMETSLGPFNAVQKVDLLIADYRANAADLILWSTSTCLIKRDSNFFEIGSLSTFHSELAKTTLSALSHEHTESEKLLSIISAVVQTYGIHDNMIQQNIGGLIFGVHVGPDGAKWQEDTNYLLYDEGLRKIDYISAFVRDETLIVNSSYTNEIRIYAHSTAITNIHEWQRHWRAYIQQHINSDKYKYWVFISTKEKVITIIGRSNLGEACKYFSLNHLGNGNFDFGFSPELMEELKRPLEPKENAIPFRINFRNG